MIQLNEVLTALGNSIDLKINPWVEFLSLHAESCRPGTLFLALKGHEKNGADFIPQAIKNGCCAIFSETPADFFGDIPFFHFPHLREKLGQLSQLFSPLPLGSSLIAVTGTNGKTSISHFIAQGMALFKMQGKRGITQANPISIGLLGTLGAFKIHVESGRLMSKPIELIGQSLLTTPDRLSLGKYLAKLPAKTVLEASSHALDQLRLIDLPIHVAIFSNLSHEHLDYHQTLERYRSAKIRLFEWPSLQKAIINLDDPHTDFFAQATQAPVCFYSLKNHKADLFLKDSLIDLSTALTQLSIQTPLGLLRTHTSLLGEFNLSNLLASVAALIHEGMSLEVIESIIPALRPPKGRMEIYPLKNGAKLVIDYAHTPDALEKVLTSLRPYTAGRLFCLFGCGGNRDKTKRPLMAKMAEKYADWTYITEDNSRFESLPEIFEDIRKGFSRSNHEFIADRAKAIVHACEQLREGDLLLLAGKGHETYMDIAGKKQPFDERSFIRPFSQ